MPGLGREEMKEGNLLLKFHWYPIISHLSTLLGFRTPREKCVIREGVHHYRTKQILSVCLEAISKELLVPYVRRCIQNENKPITGEYQEWLTSAEYNSYLFFYHIAFSYLLSIQLLIEAVRKNHSDMVIVTRIKFTHYSTVLPNQSTNNYICETCGNECKCSRNKRVYLN